MKNRVVLSLFFACFLIGGAIWMRVANASKASPSLVLAGQPENGLEIYNEELFLNNSNKSSSSTGPLTDTDLIARSLILDYVNLATAGKATESSINDLAEKYAEEISSLTKSSSISLSELNAVPNSRDNLQAYENQMNQIHLEFSKHMGGKYKVSKDLYTLGPAFYSFASSFGTGYKDAAAKLQSINVPFDVAQAHMRLINKYLSSAEAMKALSQSESNSAAAFAGLVTMDKNLDDEKQLIQEITDILAKHGI